MTSGPQREVFFFISMEVLHFSDKCCILFSLSVSIVRLSRLTYRLKCLTYVSLAYRTLDIHTHTYTIWQKSLCGPLLSTVNIGIYHVHILQICRRRLPNCQVTLLKLSKVVYVWSYYIDIFGHVRMHNCTAQIYLLIYIFIIWK